MRVTYPISLEDYRTLQPVFTGRPGHNAGFKGVLVVCFLMASLGVYCMVQGLGISTGSFLIGLGVLAAVVAYFFEKQSVGRSKEKYERNISTAYQRIHCPDQRTFEADENGFTVSCRCGIVTRPWSELMRFSENKYLFLIGTKTDVQLVPKLAFHSEGETTEFRTLMSERLNKDKPLTSRPVDLSYAKQDFRVAYILQILRGGGWRGLSKNLTTFGISAYGVFVIWNYVSPDRDPTILSGLIVLLLGIPLLRVAKTRRKHYFGPLRIYFSEEGLYLQDPGTLARNSWKEFIGYLEDNRVFLLYHNPRSYRIMPKRVLGGREAEFRTLLETKIHPYNYRIPFATPKVPSHSQQHS
jgi:hypothetical protein